MDISKSLTYAFEDKEWLSKLGLGALLTLVPVLNFAWQGYIVAIIRQVEAGRLLPLPTWDDLDKKLVDGLKVGIAQLLYTLPAFVLFFVPLIFILLPALSTNDDIQGILAAVGGLGVLGVGCIFVIYMLAYSFIAPAIQVHFAHVGTFASCFQVGPILQVIRSHPSNYVTAWVMTMLVGFVGSFAISSVSGVVSFIPCLGFILILILLPVNMLVVAWVSTVHAFLFGQVGTATSG